MLRQRTLKNRSRRPASACTPARASSWCCARRRRRRHRVPSRRSSGAGDDRCAARRNVGDTRLSSTLRADGASISTVEHLMSALAGSRHRQPARRRCRARRCRSWMEAPARSCSCCSRRASSSSRRPSAICASCARSRCATATSGRASIRSTASSSISRSTFRTRCSAAENRQRRRSISPSIRT